MGAQFDLNHLKKNSLYPSGKGVTTQPKMRPQICLGFVLIAALTSTVFGDKDADKNVDPAREPRIFYYYYTTKMTKLVTVTKQGVSTCLSSAQKQKKATTLCKGRKESSIVHLKILVMFVRLGQVLMEVRSIMMKAA